MSIEFAPAFDSIRGVKQEKQTRHGLAARATSERRVLANRRNAQRSTGPRSAAGKRRSSRNALKHGLCSTRAVLPGECPATYATFVREIEEDLQPRTAMQYSLLPHIANLMWRLDRLPQAQADIFEEEVKKCRGRGKKLTAAQVLAKRFSDEPTHNGFLLINRYEASLRAQLNRLMVRYEALQRRRPTAPWPADESPVPDEGKRPAWDESHERAQRDLFAAREHALDHGGPPPASEYEASVDRCVRFARERDAAILAKRTQPKPSENPFVGQKPGNVPHSKNRRRRNEPNVAWAARPSASAERLTPPTLGRDAQATKTPRRMGRRCSKP